MDPVKYDSHLVSGLNSSVFLCSVCGPQHPKGDIMLLWTILTQAIATLGSGFACVAGFEHCHSIAITKDGLCGLLGLPNVIFLLLGISQQGTVLSRGFVIGYFMDTGPN